MTEPIEIVRLREQIEKERKDLLSVYINWQRGMITSENYDKYMATFPDRLLALTKPDGTKAIGVIADEQELPENPFKNVDGNPYINYSTAQHKMRNCNWVKVIGELK